MHLPTNVPPLLLRTQDLGSGLKVALQTRKHMTVVTNASAQETRGAAAAAAYNMHNAFAASLAW
jgi:hypothetical protein